MDKMVKTYGDGDHVPATIYNSLRIRLKLTSDGCQLTKSRREIKQILAKVEKKVKG